MRQKLTPPAIARLWGISPTKVVAWIVAGELPAVNAATRKGGRPRYLVDLKDLAAFEASRRTVPAPRPCRRRRTKPSDLIEFF